MKGSTHDGVFCTVKVRDVYNIHNTGKRRSVRNIWYNNDFNSSINNVIMILRAERVLKDATA